MQVDTKDLLPLIRHIDNRCCADCSAPLGDFSSIFASVRYGVWLCADCAAIHEVLHNDDNDDAVIKKAQSASWTQLDVQMMKQYQSNIAFNSFYEKYFPEGWSKIKVESTVSDKTVFIKAKYISKLFFLPPFKKNEPSLDSKKKSLTNLPSALLDLFVVMAPTGLADTCASEEQPAPNFRAIEFKDSLFRAGVTSSFAYGDNTSSKVPENLEAFVYPNDCTVSTLYKSPFFFTIALTDENGRRQFGGVLQVHELMSPEDMARLLNIPPHSATWPVQWPVFYSIKSLLILSHYPYYNLFRETLEVLYRISLSAAPVPMERYIQHVITELPLPPQGKIEVAFTMGDRTLTLWRPPKNQLPMVDFSLRPLFSTLCVDNILLIFGALCTETRICFCSSNSALLGPVTESFLSFLFPFVWQGAYIPVLPYKLIDILDAPVPFIVGIDSKYLVDNPPGYRPEKVLYVDLDSDRVFYGSGPEPLSSSHSLVTIPEKMKEKLKSKLDEFGGCLHRADPNIFRAAGDLFLRNEHLVPIRHFATDSGVIYLHHADAHASTADPASSEGRKCYVTCSRSSLKVIDVLDSNNNTRSEYATIGNTPSWADRKFDGVEIRGAFLRAFVTTFLDYQDYVKETDILNVTVNPSINSSKRSTFSSFKDKAVGRMSSKGNDRRPNSLPHSGVSRDEALKHSIAMNEDGTPRDKTFFDRAAFLKDHPGDFYEELCSTQMFSVFMREQLTCPNQSEIRFFTEAIMDKRNRSKKTLVKLSTPFLSDRSDSIKKTYVPPYPLRVGIAPGSSFSYSIFPDFKTRNCAPKRDVPKLVEGPELGRLQGSVTENFKTSILGSHAHAKLVLEKERNERVERALKSSEVRYAVFLSGMIKFQALTRMRAPRENFLRKVESVKIIKKAYKSLLNYRITRLSGAKKYKCSIKIQSQMRGYFGRRRYRRLLRAIQIISHYKPVFVAVSRKLSMLHKLRRLQLFLRRRFLAKKWCKQYSAKIVRRVFLRFFALLKYRRQQNAAIRLQALIRGHLCFVKLRKVRHARLVEMRDLLVLLWRLDNTKLLHRSNFWDLLGGSTSNCTHFIVKLHELELTRLWTDLGFISSVVNKKDPFLKQMGVIQSLALRPSELTSRVVRNPELAKRGVSIKEERQRLYRAMKTEADDRIRIGFFEKFGIANGKKRKQTLSDIVWTEGVDVNDSAAVIRSILSTDYEDAQWMQAVRAERLQADVLSVAAALLYRVQNNKQKRNRRSSLMAPVHGATESQHYQ